MEIIWYGHACFKISERNMASVVTDPFDSTIAGYSPLKLKADIVTISYDDPIHNFVKAVKGDAFEINGPGEYERGGVFITGKHTTSLHKDGEGSQNTIYVLDYGTVTIAHLGHLSQVPNQSDIESLGTINVALVPVGDGSALNASKAAEVISMLEPNIVIPMLYETTHSKIQLDPLNKFLKEMGLTQLETMDSYKLTGTVAFNEEETHIIALDPRQSNG